MQLTSLSLEHFRSYGRLAMEFDGKGIELLLGPNGSGKTNIIEAVSLLSLQRSCLGVESEKLAQWGKDFFRLRAQTHSQSGESRTLELVQELSPRKQRATYVNDVRVPSAQFAGLLPTVIFLPEDLDLFTGGPERRRAFLDQLLLQLTPAYTQAKSGYDQTLKQRNVLLKNIARGVAAEAELDPWDSELARQGVIIQTARMRLADRFNALLMAQLSSLGVKWREATLIYRRKTVSMQAEEMRAELLSLLRESRQRDIILASTGTGPHRDDWQLVADGHEIATFASRGEQRACLLGLLLISMGIIEHDLGETPIILLDDVFSELDDTHQRDLLGSLGRSQAFLTATHLPTNIEAARSRKWGVGGGKVRIED